MVSIPALWLPILLSAVIVFFASAVLHMLLRYHESDYSKLADEDSVLTAMRAAGVTPGNYAFPHCTAAERKDPEWAKKCERGPVGLMYVWPSGPPAMGKALGFWFVFCVVIAIFTAYITGRCLGPGEPSLGVFRIAGTIAFLGFAGCEASNSIWKGQRWSTTIKTLIDGLIYGLLTGGVFGWLWPA